MPRDAIVSDAQGGVLPGVSITLRNTGTGLTRALVTDTQGRFALRRTVFGVTRVERPFAGLDHILGSGEIGLADFHVDDGLALRF